MDDPYNDLQKAEGAQSIWPQRLPQPRDQPDTSCMRYDLGSNPRTMQKQRRLTDLTIQTEGGSWELHRVVLGSCSPFF